MDSEYKTTGFSFIIHNRTGDPVIILNCALAPKMLLFNITFNIENRIHDQWLKWMKTNFIPAVMETKLPTKYLTFKLLTEVENGGNTYSFQFYFNEMEDYMSFEMNYKEQLLDRHNMLFRGKFVLFSTLLEEV